MTTMGPESAVLTSRLVELRATQVAYDAELPRDGPMWLEAALLARAEEERSDRAGIWGRVRTAFRRPTLPVMPAADDPRAALACLPLQTRLRR